MVTGRDSELELNAQNWTQAFENYFVTVSEAFNLLWSMSTIVRGGITPEVTCLRSGYNAEVGTEITFNGCANSLRFTLTFGLGDPTTSHYIEE